MLLIVILIFCAFCAYCMWHYSKFSYWNSSNIPQGKISALSLIFNYCTNWRLSQHMMQLYRLCRNEKWDYTGSFLFTRPILFIASPSILAEIIQHHQDSFFNRGSYYETPTDLNLFNMKHPDWWKWRKIISAHFVPAQYMEVFYKNADKTMQDIEKQNGDGIDIFKLCNNYACNIAQHFFLGINQCEKALQTSEKLHAIFKPLKWNALTDILSYYVPNMLRFCKASEFPRDAFEYVKKMAKDSIKNPYLENSLLKDLMVQKERNGLKEENIVGVLSALFLGGLKSTTPLLSYACYELAKAHEIQDKLRTEIMANIPNNSVVSYKDIKKLTFLDNVLNEVIRLHNGGPLLIRECNHSCKLELINLSVEKGVLMIASLRGILMDEEYFTNASAFDPGRFERPDFPKHAFLPFGIGRHMCIGNQFAILQTKLFLVKLVSKYELSTNGQTKYSTEKNIRLWENSIFLNMVSI